jgi:hypothetical protein
VRLTFATSKSKGYGEKQPFRVSIKPYSPFFYKIPHFVVMGFAHLAAARYVTLTFAKPKVKLTTFHSVTRRASYVTLTFAKPKVKRTLAERK